MALKVQYNLTWLCAVRHHTKNNLKPFAGVGEKEERYKEKKKKREVVTKVFEWDLKREWRSGRRNLYSQQSSEFAVYTGTQECLGLAPERLTNVKNPRKAWWHYWPHLPGWVTVVEIIAGFIRAARNQSEYYSRVSEGCTEEMKTVE